MAQPVTDDELQLRKRARRRLVGAIVLVLLVVVFLPMALDNEPKPLAPNVDIQVPSLDSPEKKFPAATPPPAVQPSAAPPASAPSPATEPRACAGPRGPRMRRRRWRAGSRDTGTGPRARIRNLSGQETRRGQESRAARSRRRRKPRPRSRPSRPAAGGAGLRGAAWAFSNAANANHLYQKLRAARFPAYLERVNAHGSTKTRVRRRPVPNPRMRRTRPARGCSRWVSRRALSRSRSRANDLVRRRGTRRAGAFDAARLHARSREGNDGDRGLGHRGGHRPHISDLWSRTGCRPRCSPPACDSPPALPA